MGFIYVIFTREHFHRTGGLDTVFATHAVFVFYISDLSMWAYFFGCVCVCVVRICLALDWASTRDGWPKQTDELFGWTRQNGSQTTGLEPVGAEVAGWGGWDQSGLLEVALEERGFTGL